MANVTINFNVGANPTITASTNITSILQSALNTAHADGILTINFPTTKATYYINSAVDVYSDTVINFNGNTIKKSISTTDVLFRAGYRYKNIQLETCTKGYGGGGQNITFTNGVFVGNDSLDYRMPIMAHHIDNLQLLNCTYTNALGGDNALGLFGCSNVLVDNCTFTGFTANSDRPYAQCIRIDNSTTISTNELGGVYGISEIDGLPTKNVIVQNCSFLPIKDSNGVITKFAPTPIGNHRFVENMYHSGIKFLNNTVQDCLAYGTVVGGANNTTAWVRFYSVKADATETNPVFSKIGMLIKGNTFKSTVTENLTLVSGVPKVAINNSAIYLQSKEDVAKIANITASSSASSKGRPQPCCDVQIVDNKFIGFNSELTERPIVCVSGITGDTATIPIYPTMYCENILVAGNRFDNCFNYAQASTNDTNGVDPANAISSDCIALYYTTNSMVIGNDYNKCRRALYATECNNISLLNARCNDVEYLPVSINNVDNFSIRYIDVDSTCTGGVYVRNCNNGVIEYNEIKSVSKVSSDYPAYIAIKECTNIQVNNNELENSTTASKVHTYGIYAYANISGVTESNNTITGFSKSVSIS